MNRGVSQGGLAGVRGQTNAKPAFQQYCTVPGLLLQASHMHVPDMQMFDATFRCDVQGQVRRCHR
jgi:hypothetical protein